MALVYTATEGCPNVIPIYSVHIGVKYSACGLGLSIISVLPVAVAKSRNREGRRAKNCKNVF